MGKEKPIKRLRVRWIELAHGVMEGREVENKSYERLRRYVCEIGSKALRFMRRCERYGFRMGTKSQVSFNRGMDERAQCY